MNCQQKYTKYQTITKEKIATIGNNTGIGKSLYVYKLNDAATLTRKAKNKLAITPSRLDLNIRNTSILDT